VAGSVSYVGALADARSYFMLLRPISLAGRVLHYGRYGSDSEDERLSQVFLGNGWLVRGYDSGSFTLDECDGSPNCEAYDRLFGSRVAVANVELRVPLLGSLGVLRTPAIPPVEAAAFYDAGVAWTRTEEASFLGGGRDPVTSYGGVLRLNLLGFAVAEFALVHPNDRPRRGWYWQFNLQPGF
jgi:outer membrane protein assembly factor BamA